MISKNCFSGNRKHKLTWFYLDLIFWYYQIDFLIHFLIYWGYFLPPEITNDFLIRKKIDFDEFWSSIKNYFFLIQKNKWKIWGVILVENIFWYQELFFISKIIFRNQEFELLISFFIFCNIPTCNASSDWKTFAYRRHVFSFLSSSVMATKRFALSSRTNLQAMGEE